MKKIVALVLSLVMVLGLATTAFAAEDKYDVYLADDTLAVDLALGNALYPNQVIEEVAAKANSDGSGNVAYLKIGSPVSYAVKTDAPTVSSYAVTAAGKSTVLYYVDFTTATEVAYAATAKVFTNFGTKCGQLYQVDTAKKYYEVEKAAVATTWLAGDVLEGTLATAAHENVLVDGKIVAVKAAALTPGTTLAPDALLKHSWAVTGVAYSASLGNVPTEAKCLNCGAVVTNFYYGAGKVPAGETGLQLGAPYTAWYIVEPDFAAAPSAPVVDGEKVESAETFDAGIAMYVGMSVMAAAGSAVVLKKKD